MKPLRGDSFSSQRLNSLRRLFDDVKSDDWQQRKEQWEEQFAYLKKRIARNPVETEVLKNILQKLGGENSSWRSVVRENDRYYACGLSDLIEMWDFLEKVTGNEL